MATTNILTATFSVELEAYTAPAYQYDSGMVLKLEGLDLPNVYEVHFSNSQYDGDALVMIGESDAVDIPDALLATGKPVYAFVYLHTSADDGFTVYKITIPVIQRPAISDEEPTPEQARTIAQLITALNEGVQEAQDAAAEAKAYGAKISIIGTALNIEGGE